MMRVVSKAAWTIGWPRAAGSKAELQRPPRDSRMTLIQRNLFRVAWRAFEVLNGLETTGSIDGPALGYDDTCFGYQPIDYESVVRALRPLSAECQRGTFIDYGCGKGRSLMLASFRPFRKVIGVEQSAALCAIARRNLERSAAWRRASFVHVVQQDAAEFVVPHDANVLFFYNPFRGPVLAKVLARVRQSLDAAPRQLNIIYALPRTDADAMASCDWLVPWRSVTTSNAWERLTIYRSR